MPDDRTPTDPTAGPHPAPGDDVARTTSSGGDEATAEVVRSVHRAERSPKDMAISLLVLLVPIALFLGFYRVVLGGDQPAVVDPAPAVAEARAANVFPVGEPTGLPSSWRPISAAFQRTDAGATVRIGYVSPDDHGAQLVESNVPAERLLPAELTSAGRAEGTVQVGGRTWQRYSGRPGERALVLLEPNRTVIVVGAAGEQQLRGLADALR